MKGRIICKGVQPDFLSGLAALFSLYYIFNSQYQEETACTLEFLQKVTSLHLLIFLFILVCD